MSEYDDWYFLNGELDKRRELAELEEATRDLGREQAAQALLDKQYNECSRDQVMHPNHYARWAMEPIEFIAINDLPWWLANVIKYCMRYDAKDGLQDLYKARSYLEMKIRRLEGVERFWDKPVTEERMLDAEVQNRS